jgi:hypothetical protein
MDLVSQLHRVRVIELDIDMNDNEMGKLWKEGSCSVFMKYLGNRLEGLSLRKTMKK